MLKEINKLGKTLTRLEQKKVFGGGDIQCSCYTDTGNAQGSEASCESCFSYCKKTYGDQLTSSWCFGG
ncbi:hypothetical protein TSEDIMI_260028 [Tenacibaculum sediminilitoris]|uniref:hypothetical protein n=1 Tax=Tenacibaculum sediminilitoris TaxID=1820334 RepID=UPI00389627DC